MCVVKFMWQHKCEIALKGEVNYYHRISQLINLSWEAASAVTKIKSELPTISEELDKETDQIRIPYNSNQVSNDFWDYWLYMYNSFHLQYI